MTGEENAVDEVVDDVDEGEEAEAEEDNSTEESDADGDGSTKKEEGEEGAEDTEDEEDEDDEPPVRKPRTNADWVAQRRKEKLDKERGKQKDDEEQGEAEDEEEDEDYNSEDSKIVEKIVDKKLKPFQEQQYTAEVKGEIDDFVAKNPDFKPFAAKALKWAQHPSWRNIPTKQLMHAAAGDKLLKMGAKRSKTADEKVRKTKTGAGTGGGNTGSSKPVWEMTDEEFQKDLEAVKTGQ